MNQDFFSQHPIVKAIIGGTAPAAARAAAAKGALPIPTADLLEVLTFLAQSDERELAETARQTFAEQMPETVRAAVAANEIAPPVLGFIAASPNFAHEVYAAVLNNQKTPDEAVALFAQITTDGELLELIALNQQRLIRSPQLLDAILQNRHAPPEAARRAQETRIEFFEKSRGATQIADELRARGNEAAAQFIEQAEFAQNLTTQVDENRLSLEDALLIAQHIEVPDDEVDDSWLSFDLIEEIYEESEAERRQLIEKIISETTLEGEAAAERIALIKRIMLMNIKDRVRLAMKGDREARSILIRDSNKIIATAVLANNRITEQEVEKIAAMRTAPEEVLRTIGNTRNWTRNYSVIHNLARNPRTPLGTAMTILTRIQTKDLKGITGNRNVSEAVRKQALRLLSARKN